jgi:hypothetical protein
MLDKFLTGENVKVNGEVARSVPSGVFAHEGCAVVTFQKLGYPYTVRKNKQGKR